MAKYSYEFKKQVVQSYLNGKGGTPYLAKKYYRLENFNQVIPFHA